jgi:hypothetical protein
MSPKTYSIGQYFNGERLVYRVINNFTFEVQSAHVSLSEALIVARDLNRMARLVK